MPVHIKDFSVETNGQGARKRRPRRRRAQPSPGRLTDRQVAELLKAAQQRACRLHAD